MLVCVLEGGGGGGCSLTISLGGCVANLLRWKGKAATLISIHITPHLLNHTHTHTPSQKKSKSPYLAGYSTAWWRSEAWYTWTNRDLISHRLPPEEAWQRLKKLYIPPSVTGQQGQTPHLSLAVILLSNTSHRPQSIGGKLASLLFSNKKTPRKFICTVFIKTWFTPEVKDKSYQAMLKSWRQQYISELT